MHDFPSARRGEFNLGGSSPRASSARRRGKQQLDDDEPTTAKRVRGRRRSLPPIEAFDATDGLPEGHRWSTWDQTEMFISNDLS